MSYAVNLKDITFSYNKGPLILSSASLSIKYGEKVFIHGPSGCGKSTLLNLIAGVLNPSSGTLELLGKSQEGLKSGEKDRFRGDHIGLIFQSFNLISYLTIYENIILPLKSSKNKLSRIEGDLGEEITRIAEHLKIKDFLHKRVTELSIGQQQRVAVARALIGSPELIIADEPTSSLDEEVTGSFMQLLIDEHKKKNFTLIFVSHDKRLSRFFDREISLLEINTKASEND